MVEMTETARILNHATARSVVALDEIGRGTSTLDGLSLAWAITEHLAETGPRTLFATHYHELTELSDRLPQVRNLHVTVREWKGDVVFLHRIAPGATDRSYGIHVAQLAGIPRSVVARAQQLLGTLEVQTGPRAARGPRSRAPAADAPSLFATTEATTDA
jgi:DNA mismatch repair protein MutS